jgi:DNA-binding NtrC family response regulator
MKKIKILIADDDKNIQFAFQRAFENKGYTVFTANDGHEVIGITEKENPSLIFMDISMPKMNGLAALETLKQKGSDIPVVIITGIGTMKTAVSAIQLGAYEYITKPLDIDKIYVVAQRALEMVSLREEIIGLKAKLAEPGSDYELIGNHESMQEVYKKIGAVSTTPNTTNILITGESGTGKELVARAIHSNSSSKGMPFIAINCAVMPENLVESELFGHEKGAFTGAIDNKDGKFEAAGNGVIFLDEIGDMSLDMQKKLLRVLQEREFYRVGSNSLIPVKARFITATNKNLENQIKNDKFRQDLYYRLNVMHIPVPPLRERGEDILLLFHHFVHKYSLRFNKEIRAISPELINILKHYNYPGNVRELENIVEQIILMCMGDVLTTSLLPENIRHSEFPLDISIPTYNLNDARKIFNDKFEIKYIEELLKASDGNVVKAANMAGVDTRTIQRLIKKYNISKNLFKSKDL